VVIGRRQRHAARLIEVPPAQRPEVIRAYLLRAGRRAGSRGALTEARSYFGVSADPCSADELRAVADRYPVFRIVEDHRPRTTVAATAPRDLDAVGRAGEATEDTAVRVATSGPA